MIDGVVRAPSLFSITLVVLPSMMETHELVVPRSMPMILPMIDSSKRICGGSNLLPIACVSVRHRLIFKARNQKIRRSWMTALRFGLFGGCNGHQGRTQDAIGDGVTLLQHA